MAKKPCNKRTADGKMPATFRRWRANRKEEAVYVEGAVCGVPYAVKIIPLAHIVEWNQERADAILHEIEHSG